jgi:two-component system, sensor histidine kinase PdtaS
LRDKREQSYALALLIFGGAVLLRIALDDVFPGRFPFITFFPAVLISVLERIWASLLVLLLSGLTGALWELSVDHMTRLLSFLTFPVVAGLPVGLIVSLRTALRRIRQHDEQTELINRELKYRIKNASQLQTRSASKPSVLGLQPLKWPIR